MILLISEYWTSTFDLLQYLYEEYSHQLNSHVFIYNNEWKGFSNLQDYVSP